MKKIGIGIIGCGMISGTYLENIRDRLSILKLVGVADLVEERARKIAQEFGTEVMTFEEIYESPEIDIVVNLTSVQGHYDVTRQALLHGKHVYTEKMLAEDFFRAKELYDLAAERGLRIAAAPDTVLGAGYQTVRKLLDDGIIGTPFAVNASVIRAYLQNTPRVIQGNMTTAGGTLPYDMGAYYIQAMLTLFGAVRRVSGFAQYFPKSYSHPANPRYKEAFVIDDPEAANFIQGAFEFECGVLGTLTACDAGTNYYPEQGLTIYGTKGRLICPDPNTYGGPVMLLVTEDDSYKEIPLLYGFSGYERVFPPKAPETEYVKIIFEHSRRGIGIGDLAWAIVNGRPHRLSNEMALHAIELVHGVIEASRTGSYYTMTTHPKRMMPLKPGFIGPDAEAVFDDAFPEDFDAEPRWDH